jgi:asparagine synthase (glutamine-hydrolysing)
MCGIAGFVNVRGGVNGSRDLTRMIDVLHHRGPDGSGVFHDTRAALGHRRLSIIDVAGGHQPMSNEDGTIWITYNGEVFNHGALRPALEAAGHRYKSRCDTETILHAYEQYGHACVTHFRGMFAFAIWDAPRQTLFVARDRLGIKPLYYYWDGRVFAFASEIKALLEHPAISPALDDSLLPEYLAFGYTSGERTLFARIRKLMPGHTLSLSLEGGSARVQVRQYWDVPSVEGDPHDDQWWIAECRRRLEESVEMRLMSDVPLGMFLSGGVDSSALAAMMARKVDQPIKTFAVGYQEASFSELGYARRVSQHIGSEHHEIVVSKEDFFDALPKLIWHEDEPIFWPSSVALGFVSKLASEHVKVVLTGEGSDEAFGGYDRYRYYEFNRKCMSVYRHVPAQLRTRIRKYLASTSMLSGDMRRTLEHTCLGRQDNYESLQLDNFYCGFSRRDQESLVGQLAVEHSPYASVMRYWDESADRSPIGRMLYADMKTYLVELLMKQDQMSMAHSLESRVPFLDHQLIEFSAGVPDRLRIRRGEGKYIMKRAVEDLLPRDIVYRKKMGFPTPFSRWLRDSRADGLLSMMRRRNGVLGDYFDMQQVEELIVRHKSGAVDATDRIWRLLNLQLWGDIFLRKDGSQEARGSSDGALTRMLA